MANRQRKKSDMATTDRRETADKTLRDNRIRNDELTIERRNKADKIMNENRLRNDEMTIHRRKINDRNPWRTLAIVLLLVALTVGSLLLIFLR
jgi:hypothetical protein